MTTTRARIAHTFSLLLSGLAFAGIALAFTVNSTPAAANTAHGSVVLVASSTHHTPRETYPHRLARLAREVRAHDVPCQAEDGSVGALPCRWDAGTAGNGLGESFVVLNGGVTADGFQRVIYVYDSGKVVRGGWAI
jgi:hypothetical protein